MALPTPAPNVPPAIADLLRVREALTGQLAALDKDIALARTDAARVEALLVGVRSRSSDAPRDETDYELGRLLVKLRVSWHAVEQFWPRPLPTPEATAEPPAAYGLAPPPSG